jgi:hypothetical protein
MRVLTAALPQIAPGHLGRRLDAEQPEHRGRDIAQRAAGAQRLYAGAHGHQRHRVGGVCGVHSTGGRIDHELAIPVVGGDEDAAARPLRAGQHPLEAAVHRLHRLDHRRQHARVAHHVGIGVVAEQEVVVALLDGAAERLGDPGRAHLGGQIVRRHAL